MDVHGYLSDDDLVNIYIDNQLAGQGKIKYQQAPLGHKSDRLYFKVIAQNNIYLSSNIIDSENAQLCFSSNPEFLFLDNNTNYQSNSIKLYDTSILSSKNYNIKTIIANKDYKIKQELKLIAVNYYGRENDKCFYNKESDQKFTNLELCQSKSTAQTLPEGQTCGIGMGSCLYQNQTCIPNGTNYICVDQIQSTEITKYKDYLVIFTVIITMLILILAFRPKGL